MSLNKYLIAFTTFLALASCAQIAANEPVYLALKADPPTSIPATDLAKLKNGQVACNIFNEGTREAYQTCWFPSGRPLKAAQLHFYKPPVRGGIVPGANWVTTKHF